MFESVFDLFWFPPHSILSRLLKHHLSKLHSVFLSTGRGRCQVYRAAFNRCFSVYSAQVEDLYLPFKPKRKTRASAARGLGLQPLADMLLGRVARPGGGPLEAAAGFVNADEGAATAEEALAGARDIAAEEVMESAEVRGEARTCLERQLVVTAKLRKAGADAEGKYRSYHAFQAGFGSVRPHQVERMSAPMESGTCGGTMGAW